MTLARFYHLAWLGAPLVAAVGLLYAHGHQLLAAALFIPLALLGASAGAMLQFRHLPGRCDCCGRPARLIARCQPGFDNRIMLSCDRCGLVVNAARFGVRIERLGPAGS